MTGPGQQQQRPQLLPLLLLPALPDNGRCCHSAKANPWRREVSVRGGWELRIESGDWRETSQNTLGSPAPQAGPIPVSGAEIAAEPPLDHPRPRPRCRHSNVGSQTGVVPLGPQPPQRSSAKPSSLCLSLSGLRQGCRRDGQSSATFSAGLS